MKIACFASNYQQAQQSYQHLAGEFDFVKAGDADVILAFGGDGLMLQALHTYLVSGKPIQRINRGTVTARSIRFFHGIFLLQHPRSMKSLAVKPSVMPIDIQNDTVCSAAALRPPDASITGDAMVADQKFRRISCDGQGKCQDSVASCVLLLSCRFPSKKHFES